MAVATPAYRAETAGEDDAVCVDPDKFRHVLGHYPTGVVIVSAFGEGDRPVGMVIGTFTSVSLDPPLVGFLPGKASRSWAMMQGSGRFCVNLLAGDQSDLCRRFSSREGKKFDGLEFELSEGGCPILPGVVGWIDCALHDVVEAGDHYFVLGKVTALEVARVADPMLFCRGSLGAVAASAGTA